MNDPERFNDVVETLLADRSPAVKARCLDLTQRRMLILAQRILGSQGQRPDSRFAEALRLRLKRRVSSTTCAVGN